MQKRGAPPGAAFFIRFPGGPVRSTVRPAFAGLCVTRHQRCLQVAIQNLGPRDVFGVLVVRHSGFPQRREVADRFPAVLLVESAPKLVRLVL